MKKLSLAALVAVAACAQQPPRPTAMDDYNAFHEREMAGLRARDESMRNDERARVADLAKRGATSRLNDTQFVASATDVVRRQLKDPGSAQFRSVRVESKRPGQRLVCGEVNAKNSYGGFQGFVAFAATDLDAIIQPAQGGRFAPNAGVADVCG